MSAPIYNVRDRVIPAYLPSATNSEAFVSAINRLLVRLDVRGVSANEIVACIKPLIADSEARATAELRAALTVAQNWVEHHSQHADDLIAQNVELRSEVERLKFYIATTIQPDEYAKVIKDLRAEVERLTAQRENLLKPMRDQAIARAERAEAEVERLTKQAVFDGDHIHTLNAAFATRAEVTDAIARAERAEAEIKDRAAMMRDVMRERDAAEAELAVERAIVSRVWVQLGSPTYAQLKGRSIYCLIDEMKAELAAERARLRDLWCEMALEYRDERISYVSVQITRSVWDELDAAMKEGK
jgi:hypothetical protein